MSDIERCIQQALEIVKIYEAAAESYEGVLESLKRKKEDCEEFFTPDTLTATSAQIAQLAKTSIQNAEHTLREAGINRVNVKGEMYCHLLDYLSYIKGLALRSHGFPVTQESISPHKTAYKKPIPFMKRQAFSLLHSSSGSSR